MALTFFNLDERTRVLMLEELRYDLDRNKVYLSTRLNEYGIRQYPSLLEQAIIDGSDITFASNLKTGCLSSSEQRKKPSGGYTTAKVPTNAHEMLAEGEFNRYYIRAICRIAIEEQVSLEIYRAKSVQSPRTESQQKIGQTVNPSTLLTDLRSHIGVDTALGLPAGPNSGLSVRLSIKETA